MSLANLTEDERQIVGACLQCVASGEYILHDWEFPILFGITPEEFKAIASCWPNLDESDEAVVTAINDAMNNLLGYPHGRELPMDGPEVHRVHLKWRRSHFDEQGRLIRRTLDDEPK